MSGPSEKTPMVNLWAAQLPERRILEDFWDFITEKYNEPEVRLIDVNLDQTLDEFHGIDQQQLDRERRLLLEACQG
jgi:hypothetical protein